MIHIKPVVVTSILARARPSLLFLLCSLLCGCNGCYLAIQGTYLARDQLVARPVARVLKRNRIDSTTRAFLELATDVRRYAIDTLGLRANNNYTTYVDSDKKHLVEVLSAARPDTFELYLWRYPFFGQFPYRGYYRKKDAQAQARRLQRLGLETWIRPAGAFSTLGLLTDPLYSFMRNYPLFSQVSLIIHEQAHATVFLKNQVGFNEELASFVGNRGALRYLESRFGTGSPETHSGRARIADGATFGATIRTLHARLDSLYRNQIDSTTKIARRTALLDTFCRVFDSTYDQRFRTPSYRSFCATPINNARILGYLTYEKHTPLFDSLLVRYNNDLRTCIDTLKTFTNADTDPTVRLRGLLGRNGQN